MAYDLLGWLDSLPLSVRRTLGRLHALFHKVKIFFLHKFSKDASEKFYSQFGEDLLLWKLTQRKKKGFFVDIGAYDGITISNSLFFEKKGWKGLLVEPIPSFAKTCRKNRLNKVVSCAVVGSKSQKYVNITESKKNPMLSGIDTPVSGKTTMHKVPALTLTNLLNKYNAPKNIDFISIDTEGNEFDILQSLDFTIWRPEYFIIEENSLKLTKKISTFLRKKGYKHITRTICNSVYERI